MGQVLAGCIAAVVACRTSSGDHTYVKIGSRLPGNRAVTTIARLRRRNMRGVLGLGIHRNILTAVTTNT